jgi:hypothetical protein
MAFFYVIARMKRPEYEEIKHLVETGYFKDIVELIKRIPPKQWYADIGNTYKTYVARQLDPGDITAGEMIKLADLLETEDGKIFALVAKAVRKKKGKK